MFDDTILKYFDNLSPLQVERFAALGDLYADWNAKVNVISRKDMDNFYLHHVLHSLAIAKVCSFDHRASVLDVGCGGGFPGIPLAIMFPEVEFTLVDSIGKKIMVVRGVADALGLDNVRAVNGRAEDVDGKFDYVVCRAVTRMSEFKGWVWNKIRKGRAGSLDNGILALKGGDLADEMSEAAKEYTLFSVRDYFGEDFFDTKQLVHIAKK